MKHTTIILAALVWTLSPVTVANRCVGEFSAPGALAPCACTVKNRLASGWNPELVLSAYFAPDGHASTAQVATVAAVLSGEVSCDPRLYFMLSRADVAYLGYEQYAPALVVCAGDKCVQFYERWFRRER